ncbi:glycosyltransferase [Amaricoccus tamworthensis]|uniref:glycosyltransferase n=1 Tax=Amaricoccus tamworthensis TaxID=57002 RepID=UPI003C7D4705
MLFCEPGGDGLRDFEELAVFVDQLRQLGHEAGIRVDSVPRELNRNSQFDLARFLVDGHGGPEDMVVLGGAHRTTTRKLARLRRHAEADMTDCLAFGSFENRQQRIGVETRLSYVFGRDPKIVDLAMTAVAGTGKTRGFPVIGVKSASERAGLPRVLIVRPDLEDRASERALISLSLSKRFNLAVLTDGKSKHAWKARHGNAIPVYHFGEMLPSSLSERVDVCVTFTPLERNYRLQCLAANLARSSKVLIDGTLDHGIAAKADVFVRGPVDVAGVAAFLESNILPNLEQIGRHTLASAFSRGCDPAVVLEALPAPAEVGTAAAGPSRIVFMPTNGVGLGHAQRCSLIAREFAPQAKRSVFAVFPSCVRLVKSFGFDTMPLIGRSGLHAQSHENDIVNYLRLGALAEPGDTLVFDGGYVFDSVYRTVLEKRLRGVWIRRGLWKAEQDNSVALDREKAFERVIVPREAFDELNFDYSSGRHLVQVGPVVQRISVSDQERASFREALAERMGRPFERLVVSLLGGGVAADRGAQLQALCGMMERRDDVLHLIVVWPTASVQPNLYNWRNSRVVRTSQAGVLMANADLSVSAAGYNSFHEALYNRAPTIFIPQGGSFMDDQPARAEAARERGVAGYVEPFDLMRLEREIGRMLDGDGAARMLDALGRLELPETGNRAAAGCIEELGNGFADLDGDTVQNYVPGR